MYRKNLPVNNLPIFVAYSRCLCFWCGRTFSFQARTLHRAHIHFPASRQQHPSNLMRPSCLRGTSSTFGDLVRAGLETGSRLDEISDSPVMRPPAHRRQKSFRTLPLFQDPLRGRPARVVDGLIISPLSPWTKQGLH